VAYDLVSCVSTDVGLLAPALGIAALRWRDKRVSDRAGSVHGRRGQRTIFGQRIHGFIGVTDDPPARAARDYLVEHRRETKNELDALSPTIPTRPATSTVRPRPSARPAALLASHESPRESLRAANS
jgi:hypothetical protein